MPAIEAELTWLDGAFRPGVRVEVGEDGRIVRIGRDGDGTGGGRHSIDGVDGVGEKDGGADETSGREALHLPGKALLPGMVDSHSHAFQRGLRGRGESFPQGGGSFWTWREA